MVGESDKSTAVEVNKSRIAALIRLIKETTEEPEIKREALERIKNDYQILTRDDKPVFFKGLLESVEARPENVKEQMEKVASNLRDKLLIRMLFHLGCRISEALAWIVADIDFNRGTITIIHLKRRVRLSCTHCGLV